MVGVVMSVLQYDVGSSKESDRDRALRRPGEYRILRRGQVDNLASGSTEKEILEAYPSLTREDIRAALAYAAEMARELYVDIPMAKSA